MIEDTWDSACINRACKVAKTLISKQHDYGKSNILDFGEAGVMVRVNDKIARLKNLHIKGLMPKNETVDDTWLDIAGYAIIAMMLRDGSFNLELANREVESGKEGD